jgi:hypothetical protein
LMLLCQAAHWSGRDGHLRRGLGVLLLVCSQGGEDGVGEPSAQEPQGCGLVLAAGFLLGQVGLAGADAAGLGDPIMCRAQFIARLPPRFGRTLPALAPDHTGTGAVPVKRAKASLSRKRCTPVVSPMITAAGSATIRRTGPR